MSKKKPLLSSLRQKPSISFRISIMAIKMLRTTARTLNKDISDCLEEAIAQYARQAPTAIDWGFFLTQFDKESGKCLYDHGNFFCWRTRKAITQRDCIYCKFP